MEQQQPLSLIDRIRLTVKEQTAFTDALGDGTGDISFTVQGLQQHLGVSQAEIYGALDAMGDNVKGRQATLNAVVIAFDRSYIENASKD